MYHAINEGAGAAAGGKLHTDLGLSRYGEQPRQRQTLRVVYKDHGSTIRILSPKIEKQLFALQCVAAVLSQSRFEMDKLIKEVVLRTTEFYQRAKKANIEFYQFGEWIDTQLRDSLFNRDREFE